MIVMTSFGRVALRRWGIRQLEPMTQDLLDVIRLFGAGVERGQLHPGTDLYLMADRLIRASTASPLPDDLPVADMWPLLHALWDLNGLQNLGKVLGLYPQALRIQALLMDLPLTPGP